MMEEKVYKRCLGCGKIIKVLPEQDYCKTCEDK